MTLPRNLKEIPNLKNIDLTGNPLSESMIPFLEELKKRGINILR